MDLTKLSDKDLEALASGDMTKVSDEGLAILAGKEPKGVGAQALDYGLRGLDYAGGLVRGGIAGGIEAGGKVAEALGYEGTPNLVNIEDVLAGKAPTTSDVMEKLGVAEMGSLSDVIPGAYTEKGDEWLKFQKGGPLDVTGRGTVGLAGDIALDPLTYATFGASALAKLGKAGKTASTALKPTATAIGKGGKAFWKSALGRIDEEAMKYGKEPVSDLLLKKDVYGSAEDIYRQMDDMAGGLAEEQKKILGKATEAGGQANMRSAMQGTIDKIAEYRASRDPRLAAIADALEADVAKYLELDPKLVAKETPEYLQKMNVFEGEKSRYLDMASKYRKSLADYRKAGGTPTQDIIPGQLDLGQGLGTVKKEVPLQGEDVFMAAEKASQEPFQYSLMEIPKYKVNVKGGIKEKTKLDYDQLSKNIAGQEPTMGYKQLGIENFEPQGIEKALVDMPAVAQAPPGFQTSMILEPPTRPTKPQRPKPPTELTPAITPEQASRMKTSVYESIPQGDFAIVQSGMEPSKIKGLKTMASGLKQETEDAVGRVLGAGEQARLVDVNKELGQLLTTKDRQLHQAFLEGRKTKGPTEVTASLAGAALASPAGSGKEILTAMLAAKEAVRAAKFTGPRTTIGRNMSKFGDSALAGPIWDTLLRQQLINANREE